MCTCMFVKERLLHLSSDVSMTVSEMYLLVNSGFMDIVFKGINSCDVADLPGNLSLLSPQTPKYVDLDI